MFYNIDSISPVCAQLHAEGKSIILATGFFDLLHSEHINFLQKAKAKGDILIVAVESDERARALKGEGRPVETQLLRCQHLLGLLLPTGSDPQNKLVDCVLALPPDFDHFEAYDSLMFSIKPDIYAVSAHTSHQNSKEFLAQKYGGHLEVVHDWNPDISTTKLISQNHV